VSGPLLLKGFEVELFTGRQRPLWSGMGRAGGGGAPGFVDRARITADLEYDRTQPRCHYTDQLTIGLQVATPAAARVG